MTTQPHLSTVLFTVIVTLAVTFNFSSGDAAFEDWVPVQEAVALQRLQKVLNASQHANTLGDVNSNFIQFVQGNYASMFDAEFHKELSTSLLAVLDGMTNTTSRCIPDILNLLEDMTNLKPYTLKVLDALGKPPSGISEFKFLWMGSYDVCTSIKEYETNSSHDVKFQGKHCLVLLRGPVLALLSPLLTYFGFTEGICVPRTCAETDLTPLLDIGLGMILKRLKLPDKLINETLQSSVVTCAEPATWTTGDICTLVLIGVILYLLICGTFYDVVQRVRSDPNKLKFPVTSKDDTMSDIDSDNLISDEVSGHGLISNIDTRKRGACSASAVKAFFHQFLISFSVVTNTGKLLNAGMREGQLGAINGIRVLSMWWVILGHTYAFVLGSGSGSLIDNVSALADTVKRFTFQAILNATFSVDSFFFLSGLLLAYLLLRELRMSEGKTNWALLYFHRFWRLTPVYMFVILVYTTILRHLPEGPFMRAIDGGAKQCNKYWWANLLYINNFIPSELGKECLGWAWYLANDMQFFVISPVIIYLLYRFHRIGLTLVSALILMCVIVNGVMAKIDHASASIMAPNNTAMGVLYVRPWYRISPYMVGIATGYFIYLWENSGRHFIYTSVVVVGWCMAIAINMSVLYGVYGPNHTSVPWSEDVSAFYLATSRFAWSLGLGWMTYACITGYGGPVNVILSWRGWAPLGRLTYCAYLVHPIVMFYYYTSLKTLIHYTDMTMIYLFVAHLTLSYAVAFVLSIAVEAPMLGLEKIIFKRKKD